ncbi:MAG: DUF2520 domain-containing protein [Flavobacteriales bacterium]|nr:DUF2520 domain-containing protein [Flavobacteriales bacterium]
MNFPYSITVIGSGNLAWHVCKQLSKLKAENVEVINHKKSKRLETIAQKFEFTPNDSLKSINKNSDFYLICVSDSAISSVIKSLDEQKVDKPVLICSGTYNIEKLKVNRNNKAIFYPLQSFRIGTKIKWKEVPLFIEANEISVLSSVKKLAYLFSKNIHTTNYKQRISLHLAAVFANNFTNSFFAVSEKLIKKSFPAQSLELLEPILEQTIKNAVELGPVNSQTGPAVRSDKETMSKHEEIVAADKRLLRIYKEMSNLIAEQQKKHA